ncbi:sensor histidine kinase [Hominibacterium faecale]|uniref:sensor histidine kinase n=1 Tax=Hominibacterium faecale TaxID=2839743 RepID=UPI0022B29A79|nr:sensor histidine kinase [Hominibacterium faecale]
MEALKKNQWAKLSAFLLLLVFAAITFFSAIVVIKNLNYGWYSQSGESVKADIYHETALQASSEIMEAAVEYGDYQDLDGSEVPKLVDYGPDEEILAGEKHAAGFGYTIFSAATQEGEERQAVRAVNASLESDPQAYTETFDHSDYRIAIYLKPSEIGGGLPAEIGAVYLSNSNIYQYRSYAIAVGIAGLVLSIALFCFLMASAGYGAENESEGILKILPLDLLGLVSLIVLYTALRFLRDIGGPGDNVERDIVPFGLGIMMAVAVITGFFMVFSARTKQSKWWHSTVLYQGLHILRKGGRYMLSFMKTVPLVWRTALGAAVFLLLNLMLVPMMYNNGVLVLLWGGLLIAACVFVVYIALGLKKLQEGGKHLADGDLSYQIDKSGLRWDLASHAEDLNSIGKGMSKAVEERLKSERFKSELITNVSHDIKTPLTSIINYVDFLKKEELDNEQAKEYIKVLDRQSGRLKKLIEDLVDASKAATGNVKLNLSPCQVGVLMTQTTGEYKEKAEASDLNIIMRLPEQELEIMADGRRLWRVFDNLLNNICKYSQPGTRVYLSLEEKNGDAVITYRNTSRYELDISEEELMERFVRGDSSRHTEGSGLGLSIARNLVELQGGTFDIVIDGDLFKVVIRFKTID